MAIYKYMHVYAQIVERWLKSKFKKRKKGKGTC